ncbi:MAG: DsbA family protein [Acidimicrobiales bacterium]
MTDNLPIELVYHADPLCGWCFAIAPALAEARSRIGDRARWTLRMGGLVVGERVRPVGLDAAYLRSGLAQVAAATGREAGDRYYTDIVDRGTWVSDSEPVCRAVLVAEELGGTDAAFAASHALSDALYLEGREPDAPTTVRDLATALGLDAEEFLTRWGSDAAAARLAHHWDQTRAMGLTTYPTIAIAGEGVVTPLVVGAASADDIVDAIEQHAGR